MNAVNGCLILKGGTMELSEGVPETIPVLPLGHVVSSKGEFDVDGESFRAMQEQIAERGVDLVVDYEHQTLKGCEAPAAGWVKELKLEDGQIRARVQWTPRGAQYLKNREYRYLSPVVNVRRTDSKAVGLHSLALTNTPAVRGMNPIVNSENFDPEGGETMDIIKKLAGLLGLGEDSCETEVLEALEACIAGNKASRKESGENSAAKKEGVQEPPAADDSVVANKAVCELLGLKAGAPASDVSAKIMELKGGTIDGINILAELKALKAQNAQRDAGDAVTLALKEGKITPAQKEWAQGYALGDPEGFKAFMEKAPRIVPMGTVLPEDGKALKDAPIDEATLMVCKQMGISIEDLKKYGMKED